MVEPRGFLARCELWIVDRDAVDFGVIPFPVTRTIARDLFDLKAEPRPVADTAAWSRFVTKVCDRVLYVRFRNQVAGSTSAWPRVALVRTPALAPG